MNEPTARLQNVDKLDYSVDVMEQPHGRIHDGHHFVACYAAAGVASGTTVNATVEPLTGKVIHMIFVVTVSGPATITIYKGSSGISGGTPTTPVNSNWLSANLPEWSLRANATVSTPGTAEEIYNIGGTGGLFGVAQSGAGGGRFEYILTDTTPLHIAMKSGAAGTNMSVVIYAYDTD